MRFRILPTRILVIYLSILAILANLSWGGLELSFWANQIFHFFLLLAPGYVLYKVFTKFKIARKTPFDNKLITTLILFLLFDPLIPWFVFLLLGILSELIQRLVRLPSGPVFNPAAAAAIIVSFLQFLPGWWGTSFSPRVAMLSGSISVAMFFILIALYVAHKYHKIPLIIFSFLAYAVSYIVLYMKSPLFLIIEGTIAFFIIVMVVEPKTSPIKIKEQAVFGTLVGIGSVVLIKMGFLVPNIGSLLLANGLYNLYRNSRWLKSKFLLLTKAKNTPLNTQS